MRWTTQPPSPIPPRAICSWHPLNELTRCLHLVQAYIQQIQKKKKKTTGKASFATNGSPALLPLKRKFESHDDTTESRDRRLGTLTPVLSGKGSSQSPSATSRDSSVDASDPEVYNGTLERKEGWIVAKRVCVGDWAWYEPDLLM